MACASTRTKWYAEASQVLCRPLAIRSKEIVVFVIQQDGNGIEYNQELRESPI